MDSPEEQSGPSDPVAAERPPSDTPKPWEIVKEYYGRGREEWHNLIWDERFGPAEWYWATLQRWCQIFFLALRGYYRNDGMLRASALTYTTFLSIVPFLAVAISVLTSMGLAEEYVDRFIEKGVIEELSVSSESLGPEIRSYVDKMKEVSLGGVGALVLFLISVSLVATVEKAMNTVWGIARGRTLFRRSINYAGLLVMASIAIAVVTFFTSMLHAPKNWELMVHLSEWVSRLIRFVIVFSVFVAIYKFIPNTKVKTPSALVGGAFAAVVWQVADVLYFEYSVRFAFDRFDAVYGGFAVILISLIWVYVTWSIILFGSEISCGHQNLIARRRERWPEATSPAERETLGLRLAALLTRPMLEPLSRPYRALSINEISDLLHIAPQAVKSVMNLYLKEGLAAPTGEGETYLLCRSPSSVSVHDVLRLIRHGSFTPEAEENEGMLDRIGQKVSEALVDQPLEEMAVLPLDRIRTYGMATEGDADAAAAGDPLSGRAGLGV